MRRLITADIAVTSDYAERISKWMASQLLLIPSEIWLEERAALCAGIEYLVTKSVDPELAVAIFRAVADRIEELHAKGASE